MSGVGSAFNLPHFIKAESPRGLQLKMLENNLNLKAECQYFDISFDGKQWFAWYYKISDEAPSLVKRKASLNV